MGFVQLGGLVLAALALCCLVAALVAHIVRFIAIAMKRPVGQWDGFYAQWPKRFVILGIVGLALGYGMMWGPSLVVGAKLKSAAQQAEQAK